MPACSVRRLCLLFPLLGAALLAGCGTKATTAITVAIAPESPAVATGGAVQFSAAVGGSDDTTVTWSVKEGSAGGTITQGGAYLAPQNAGTFHILASSNADPTRGGEATVTVSAGLSVAISLDASSAELVEGATRQFTATVTGASDSTVSWVVLEGASGGQVSSTGLYTAPANDGTFHLVATANADSSKSATAAIQVDAPPAVVTIAIDPAQVTVPALGTASFGARITGSSNTAVSWAVEESQGGSIDANGNYTAPNLAGTFHVLATSAADSSKTAEAVVDVGAPALVGISVSPTTASIAAGAQQQLIATVTNSDNTSVNWTVDESGAGAVDDNGLYTAPNAGGTFHVRATSAADPSKSATAAVTVSPPLAVAVAVTPLAPTLPADASLQFSAAVSNATSSAVVWSIDESAAGSITTGGLYTAPHAAGTFHVRATSAADTAVFGEATVSVSAPSAVSVTVSPLSTSLVGGAQQQFAANVLNASSTSVTWSIDEASAGSISTGGLYTAPLTAGTFHVRATSVSDNSKSGVAAVTVTVVTPPPITVSVSPGAPTIAANSQQQFSVTVSNATNTAVTWSVDEATGGSVTINGLYTAPNAAGTFHVRATSNADGTTSNAAAVTVLAPPAVLVSLSPQSASIAADATQQLTATVTNATNNAVTWSIDESSAGTVTQLGLYTAPHAAGVFHVRATSVADTSKFAESAMTVSAPPPVAVAVSPKTAFVQTSTGWQFTASVSNATDTSVTWSVVGGSANGSVTAGGFYTAPASAGTYTVKATSNADNTKSDTGSIVVTTTPPNVVVTVGPANPIVATHGTIALTATVTGTSNSAVTWSVVNGTAGGTIDGNGNYTAPATASTYTVRATSVANNTAFGQINVRVDSVTVAVAPTAKTIPQSTPSVNQTQQFTSTVTIGNNDPLAQTVTWSVTESGGGSVTNTGLYTAPQTFGVFHVVATSTADTTVSASAAVNITAPIAAPPSNVLATPGNQSVALTWSSAVGAVTYNVYFSQHGGVPGSNDGVLINASSGIVINGLSNGVLYDFAVTSVNSGGESGDSAIASAAPIDVSAPLATVLYPTPNTKAVALTVSPFIEFNKQMNAASLSTSINLSAPEQASVPGAVSFDGLRATFVPSLPLTPLTVYTVTVTNGAKDAFGNAFAGTSWSFTTQAAASAAVQVLLGNGSLTLSWSKVTGAEFYTVYRGTVSGGPYEQIYGTLGLSFTDPSLSNGTDYYYLITATTADGEGAPSQEVFGAPSSALPNTTGLVTATPENAEVILSWNGAGDSSLTYNVFRATASGGPYTNLVSTGNSLGYTDTGLTNGTPYYYMIRSIDTHQNSSTNSMEVNATPSASLLPAPQNLHATDGNSYVTLSWSAVASAAQYVIYRTTTYSGPYTTLYMTSASNLTYTDLTASNNTAYFYVVAAVDSQGNIGSYSTAVEGDPAVFQQTLASTLSVTQAYNNKVYLTWTSAPGATSYTLNRTLNGTTIAVATSGLSFTDTGVADGTTYTYQVTTANQGFSALSNMVTATPALANVFAPTNVIVHPGVSSMSLSWDPVPGATSYTVKYGIQSGGPYTTGTPLTVGPYPLATYTGLGDNTTFYYVVTASGPDTTTNGTQTSGNSMEVSGTPTGFGLPTAPSNDSSVAGPGFIDLFWNPVVVAGNPSSDQIEYNVYRTTGNMAWKKLTPTPTLSTGMVDTGLTNGQTYYYSFSAVLSNSGTEGPWSTPFAITPTAVEAAPPANITVYPGNAVATVTWNAEPGVNSGFEIYTSSVSGGPYQGAAFCGYYSPYPSCNFTIANSDPASPTPTYFVMRSSEGSPWGTSADSPEFTITTYSSYPSIPSVTPNPGDGQVVLNWNSVANAASFKIYRTIGTEGWTQIGTSAATHTGYIDSTVVNDTTYYYAVSAVGGSGQESAWSNPISTTPHARQPLAPQNLVAHVGNGSMTLTWTPVPAATSYLVYTSGISGGPYSGAVNTYSNAATLTSLGGAPIYAVVTASEGYENVTSGYSAQITATANGPLLAPPYATVTAENEGVYLTWPAVSGASGYDVYRAFYYNPNSSARGEVWTLVGTPSINAFLDPGVANGTTYVYAVAGVAPSVGEGTWAFSGTVTPISSDPLAPTGIYAHPGSAANTITWDTVSTATSYSISYSAVSGGPYTSYTSSTTPELTLPASNGATVYYVVQTNAPGGTSGYSAEVSTAAVATLPTTTNVQTPQKSAGQISVTWSAVAGASAYAIYRYTPGGARWTLQSQVGAVTNYVDTTVVSGTGYVYAVAAANGSGIGAWSNPTAVVTAQ